MGGSHATQPKLDPLNNVTARAPEYSARIHLCLKIPFSCKYCCCFLGILVTIQSSLLKYPQLVTSDHCYYQSTARNPRLTEVQTKLKLGMIAFGLWSSFDHGKIKTRKRENKEFL